MLKTFSMTDVGKKRELNQDYIYTSEMPVGNLPNLFIVADGMGGHNAGDYASRYTVETMIREISESEEKDPQKLLQHAIECANAFVHKKAAICKLQTAAIVNDDPCLSSYPIQAGENFVQRIL